MAPPRRRGLGRGLGALIGSSAANTQETETPEDSVSNEAATDTTSSKKSGSVSKSVASAGTGKTETKKSASTTTTKGRAKSTTNNVSVSRETSRATSVADKASSQPKNTSNKRPVDFFFTTEADRAVSEQKSADKTVTQKKVAKPRKAMPDVLSPKARGNVSRGTELTVEVEPQNKDENEALVPVPGATFMEVPVKDIHPNRKQPRQVFDEDELAELVHSIKEIG
uniref:ParB N-terminal domain-containing protein n=1 Tax=Pseudoglutamicibacter cumminsii TaxID=156979 RepID=UPI0026EBD639